MPDNENSKEELDNPIEETTAPLPKVNWIVIIATILVAIGLSAPFHLGWIGFEDIGLGFVPSRIAYMLAALGTLVAGWLLWKHNNKVGKQHVSLFGASKVKSIAFVLVPIVCFTVFGFENPEGINKYFYAFLFVSINMIYALAEEFLWRGTLQDSLRPLHWFTRFAIVGLVWGLWHLRFDGDLSNILLFLFLTIGSSVGLGKITEETRSLFLAAALHLIIIVLTNSSGNSAAKMWGGISTIVIWILILRNWKKERLFF